MCKQSFRKQNPKVYLLLQGGSVVVFASIGLVFLTLIFSPIAISVQAQNPTVDPAIETDEKLVNIACKMTDTVTVGAMQGWHGQINHLQPPPYDSADIKIISDQLEVAKARCIQALVLDWYGPVASTLTLTNNTDRAHIDLVFQNMLTQAQSSGVNHNSDRSCYASEIRQSRNYSN